ncbi:MAG: tRNA (N6-isopentenyl adenosine(37)-C2)-methylthiotransferase MiaB [Clostridia bacterium]|nr:tRNA (N6-isopentenyl adenosine(37)-C2)-methylthiotransferase MiaB [Clostridia bacterium]
MENKFYYIQTFGCQMNIHDSEKIAGMLKTLGYKEAESKEQADIIVFNTCCIRESAELKIMAKIGDVKALKKAKKDLIVVVCGCMTQQKGMAENLKKKFPFLNVIIGTHNVEELAEIISKHTKNKKNTIDVWDCEKQIKEHTPVYRTSKFNAWVNIMYGCNNFCTYCIVPYVRGRERSRKVEDIKKEVEDLVKTNKYKTITLLGQNVNSYGNDFKDEKTNFVSLLTELCNIEGDFKIKFMTSHPKDFSPELIDFIATNKKMSHAIHLPVQSGSNTILKAMNRRYTVEHYRDLVKNIYSKINDATLTTDIIVGFPGETDDDFEATCDLLKYCNYSGVFGFVYSKRRGTPAEKFDNQISIDVKRQRITKLFEIQHGIVKQLDNQMIEKTYEVLVEEKIGNNYIAKTDSGKTIKIKEDAPNKIKLGQFVNVRIKKALSKDLVGEVVK